VELTTTSQIDDGVGFDVVVLDNVTPPVLPKANLIAINIAHTNFFPAWNRMEAPPIVDWKSSHPLLRSVNFDNVQIAESFAIQTPSWALPLVEAPNSPLLMAGELNRQRVIWMAFDTLQSTWPLRVSFPIFIANAIDWLNPASEKAASLAVKAGDPLRVALSERASAAEIVLPDGSSRSRSVDANRHELLFGETQKQGVYKVREGTNDITFCVNLLDTLETDTTPRKEIQFGAYTKIASTTKREANLELWRWFALTALFILLFEWWYYHRRTA
jgi:Ca-activated chloride channel homolog